MEKIRLQVRKYNEAENRRTQYEHPSRINELTSLAKGATKFAQD